jgi:hypothetical protein
MESSTLAVLKSPRIRAVPEWLLQHLWKGNVCHHTSEKAHVGKPRPAIGEGSTRYTC